MYVALRAMNGSRRATTFDRCLPVGAAIVALACGASAGMNRDFGFFVYELLAVPLIATAFGALFACMLTARSAPRRRSLALSLAMLAIAGPIAYATANRYRDEVRFALWAPAHAALLARFANRDGVIADWDRWGFAGLESTEYLVAIHARPRAGGSPCTIVSVERLRSSIYAVTTLNCTLGPTTPARASRAISG